MLLDHPLANSQADAGAGILPFRMHSLEHIEDLLAMSGLDPDAVVANRERPRVAVALGRDVHTRWLIAAKLDRGLRSGSGKGAPAATRRRSRPATGHVRLPPASRRSRY